LCGCETRCNESHQIASAHKTSLTTPFLFDWSDYSKPGEWVVVSICIRVIDFCFCFSDIPIRLLEQFWRSGDFCNSSGGVVIFGTVLTEWWFLEQFWRSGDFWNSFDGVVIFGTVLTEWWFLFFILLEHKQNKRKIYHWLYCSIF
jgi:hypothetical protein